jgi:hypothetical protein
LSGRRKYRNGVLACILTAGFLALSPVSGMAATRSAKGEPRYIAVSVPAQPVSLKPGATSQIPIRVLNPGATPVTVRVKGAGIDLADNGKVRYTGATDPIWSHRTEFPLGDLTVPAQGYANVAITVNMPTHIAPDFYYVGFLVTPVETGTGVVQINQIGDFVTINVPGPRERKLSAFLRAPLHGIDLDGVVIGSGVVGNLDVHNIGKAAAQFWGENDVSSWFRGADPIEQRIPISLLPIGRSRSFVVTAGPAFPIDLVTTTVSVLYAGRTETSTKQIVITRRFLVINPWVIGVACALLLLALIWWLRSRHLGGEWKPNSRSRRRRSSRTMHSFRSQGRARGPRVRAYR